jgi:O-antigen/teichoic acid export membrane protein
VLASIPLIVLLGYFSAVLMGQEQFRVGAGLSLVAQVAELVGIGTLLLVFGRTAEMAFLGNALGLLVGAGLTALVVRKFLRSVWRSPVAASVGAALSFGVRGQVGNIATLFNYRLDVFIVNYFLNPAQVGLYALGVVVSEGLWQIPRAAAVALFPGQHAL